MKVAILIHVHRDPDLLNRLVSRLLHPKVDIYVNVDAKVDIAPFESTVKNVTFIRNRMEVEWGRFSQVQQMLNSYQEIMLMGISYSHILFISGQDYPVKSINYIVEFLENNPDKSFLDYHPLEEDEWSSAMKKRYEYWHFLPKNDIRNNQHLKRTLIKLGFKRNYPLPVYYGSCWMCLSTVAVFYAINYTYDNPSFVKFNQHTGCADELYFQSILVNSPLKDILVNNIYRYIDWSEKGKSPKVLTMDDLDRIKSSDVWFARKVDPEVDSLLIDGLDTLNM